MNEFETALAAGDLAAMRKAIQATHDERFAAKVAELNGLREDETSLVTEHREHINASRQARAAAAEALEAVTAAQKAADMVARESGRLANLESSSRTELASIRERIATLESELRSAVKAG